ncbi:MAG: NUDIX domain-containing protein [Candidatus Peribacteria bacterium]|jgi:8-oxo-dGTP pyrophosphatase MutT (NUDIX family)|nr:NUDIX domain-containing protein [Candidatus Peribacteria bacterium]
MLSFKEKNKKFNFRVGAIIISIDKQKVLMHTIAGYDFYLLPGGRVNWLENSVDALKRELREELGLTNINPVARLNLENFFNFSGMEFHEISNDFVIELTDDHKFLEEKEQFFGEEGEKYIFKWFPIEKIDNVNIKPALLKEVIKSHNESYQFLTLDER